MAETTIDVGSLVMSVYADGRAFRAQVTNLLHPHIVIRHLDGDGCLVGDPPHTVRLFWADTLTSVSKDAGGNPFATLEPDWPETRAMAEQETRDAA